MTPETSFNSGAIAPFECLKLGWAAIKDRYWLFLGVTLVATLLGGAVPIVLIGPMMCGLYMCLLARMRGEEIEFGMLFKGFDYFVQGLVAAAIQTGPVLVLVIAGDVIFLAFTFAVVPRGHQEPPPPIFWLGLTVFVIFAVVVSMAIHAMFVFAYPLIVDRKLSGLDAIKTSFRAAMKNLGGILGLILINVGLGIVGVLLCFVGVYFVLPLSFAAYAAAYRQVFPDRPLNFSSSPPPPPASWAA